MLLLLLMSGMALFATGCARRPAMPAQDASARQLLCFPSLKLAEGEYIQSVEIAVREGRIASVNALLDDWDIELVWDHPALLMLKYQARHFSAGLPDLHRLDGFIAVEVGNPKWFGITATMTTASTDNTGRGERKYLLSTPDLVLKPVVPGG